MPHARRSLAQQLLKFLHEPIVAVVVSAGSSPISWEDAYALLDGLDPRAVPEVFPEVTLWTPTHVVLVFSPARSHGPGRHGS